MKNAFIWFFLVGFFSAASVKSDYISDLSEEDFKKLQEIARYLRSGAQKPDAAEKVLQIDTSPEAEIESQLSGNELNPPFEYRLPTLDPGDGFPPFAASPFDPRYYQDYKPSVASTGGPYPTLQDAKEKRPQSEAPKELQTNHYDTDQSVLQVPVTGLSESGLPYERGVWIVMIIISILGGIVVLIFLSFGCWKLQKNAKAAEDVDYPAYGVTGPNKDIFPTSGDRRLAQSAHMYHYQHQKQQIIAMESVSNKERRSSISDAESEDENEEGEYTVYECPGLAPTAEMEVKNPLFMDDQTPAPKSANDSTEESQELPK